jgi:hypothetical protein
MSGVYAIFSKDKPHVLLAWVDNKKFVERMANKGYKIENTLTGKPVKPDCKLSLVELQRRKYGLE